MENETKGKVYPYQKVIQMIYDIHGSDVEALRLKIQKHPERVLYKGAERENFNFYRGQIALRFDVCVEHNHHQQNNRNITTCLNGKGIVKQNNKDKTENILKLWNEMNVVGMVRTSLDTTNPKRQQQINVIVQGDIIIYNNSINSWFVNQRLVAVLPLPRLYEGIHLANLPSHAFYPLIEAFDVNKHTRYATDLIYYYLAKDQDSDKSTNYPKWVRDIAPKLWQLDIMKGLSLSNIKTDLIQLKKHTDNVKIRKAFYSHIFDTKDETDNLQKNLDLMAESFVQYEKAHVMLNEKIIGKVATYTEPSKLGTIIVNNGGTSIYPPSPTFHINNYGDHTISNIIKNNESINEDSDEDVL